ncbi:MAG: NHL repeat-containing protein [Bdellovibrionota bacterium]
MDFFQHYSIVFLTIFFAACSEMSMVGTDYVHTKREKRVSDPIVSDKNSLLTEGDTLFDLSCENDSAIDAQASSTYLLLGCLLSKKDSGEAPVISAGNVFFRTSSGSNLSGGILDLSSESSYDFVIHVPKDLVDNLELITVELTVDSVGYRFNVNFSFADKTALLTWKDGGTLSFDGAPLHTSTTKEYQIIYNGSSEITIGSIEGLNDSLFFVGGSYPGSGGTCGDIIRENCMVRFAFKPEVIAGYSTNLILNYSNGLEDRQLSLEINGQGAFVASAVWGQSDFSTSLLNNGQDPNAGSLNRPASIYFDGTRLFLADALNNRVLIWNSMPINLDVLPDVVLGQSDFASNLSNRGGSPNASTLNTPQGIYSDGTNLFVADTENHRILVWTGMPTVNGQSANRVLGQVDFLNVAINRGNGSNVPAANSLAGPVGVYGDGNQLFVADTLNHRILAWSLSLPNNDMSASLVLGQPDFVSKNTGASDRELFTPRSVFSDQTSLVVADTFNHRVLIWNNIPTVNQEAADIVIGQADFVSAQQNRGSSAPSANSMYSPQSVGIYSGKLVVTDRRNHRVLLWNTLPTTNGESASLVFGQGDFISGQANRSKGQAAADSLSYPNSAIIVGSSLFVTEEENHRLIKAPLP